MQLLSKAAVVDVYEDEFGEVSWELKPEMVFWKIAASVVDPTYIFGAVIDGGIPNKLYALCRLLLSGWLLSDDIPNEYNLASPRHLNRRILSLPLSFSMALDCLEDVVGRKGLDALRTGCCDGYYKALLELEDLRSFHALEDFVAFQNKHFLLWPKGNPCLHWMHGLLGLGGIVRTKQLRRFNHKRIVSLCGNIHKSMLTSSTWRIQPVLWQIGQHAHGR